MQAIVVSQPNEFSVQELEQPVPGPNEALCRVRAVTICGTDSHLLRGDYPGFWPPSFPFTPGHEWAGEIVELGEGSAALGWSVGDRVAGTSHDACGYCQKCVEGRYNLCENYGVEGLHRQYGHNYQGAFAEYVTQGVKSIFHLPDSMDLPPGRPWIRPLSHCTLRTGAACVPATLLRFSDPGPSGFCLPTPHVPGVLVASSL